ncbi:pyruvate kinase [Desulfohalobiaceae bacterium Ax17]|uniref:pyruvate kinase n=1 Tax=Desulfovulcanus ferrireducens TaxID=2831190 RepID=UPI00207BCD39|nr:pyruvate kinase [Desulfovulcanus ferrireducens]MBT8762743.1 pyruvate kinase [Desulfovulcanus ferrireducens]
MRTKIIATLGPASEDVRILKGLITNGVRIFRLNFSHGSASDFLPLVSKLRTLEQELQIHITILQDLSGPKIRTGILKKSPLTISIGQEILMGPSELNTKEQENFLPFENKEILKSLSPGDIVRLSDGGLKFEVINRQGELVKLKAFNAGLVSSRKGVSFPGKKTSVTALTEKDRQDLINGLKLGIDAVALSFVQGPEDIASAKAVIDKQGRWVPVIAKLERQVAVERLPEILNIADGIMVARGDLGLECPLSSLPTLQKKIIKACNQAAKPVIVATQMLLSMVTNPMPTRAETTDIANAILDGADCLMLSEETAIGRYPVEAVEYMREIALEAEKLFFEQRTGSIEPKQKGAENFLAYVACQLAEKISAKALVAHTNSGATARLISAGRPSQPIFGLTPSSNVLKYMNFSWGVNPIKIGDEPHDHLQRTQKFVEESSSFNPGDKIVITAGHPKPGQENSPTNLLKIYCK